METKTNLFSLLNIFVFLASTTHGLNQDFCVADTTRPETPAGFPCKKVENVTANDFVFKLRYPTDKIPPFNFGAVAGFAPQFPGLNGLGLSVLRTDMPVDGVVPLHSHPRESELVLATVGKITVGFISSSNVVYFNTLGVGDTMILPPGLMHFEINVGDSASTFFAVFNSQSPGLQITSNALFGNSMSTDLLESVTLIAASEIKKLKAVFGGSN